MTSDLQSRSNHVQKTLRLCALELDASGSLKNLAAAMATRPNVFWYWIKKGHVPKVKAEWLQSNFPAIARAETLVRQGREKAQ